MTTRISESKIKDFNSLKIILELNLYFGALPLFGYILCKLRSSEYNKFCVELLSFHRSASCFNCFKTVSSNFFLSRSDFFNTVNMFFFSASRIFSSIMMIVDGATNE